MISVELYVYDLVIVSNNFEMIQSIGQALSERFDMTYLGDPKYFLGMKIDQDLSASTISISQSKFAKDILEKYGMDNINSVKTPQESGLKLTRSMCVDGCKPAETMEDVPYRNAIGCLMCFMVGTRRILQLQWECSVTSWQNLVQPIGKLLSA